MSIVVPSSDNRHGDSVKYRLKLKDNILTLEASPPFNPNNSPQNNNNRTLASSIPSTNNNNNNNSNNNKTCCMHLCCCCPCSWSNTSKSSTTKTQGVTDTNNKKEKTMEPIYCVSNTVPSIEEIRSWGKSFEKLLKHPVGRMLFREFLRREYSEENILFWEACDELKSESNASLVEEKARFIYEDYISILSPKEVSLDSQVRESVNTHMLTPKQNMFDEAQAQIYTLMHRDSYPRFVNSVMFKQIADLPAGKCSAATATASASTANNKTSKKS